MGRDGDDGINGQGFDGFLIGLEIEVCDPWKEPSAVRFFEFEAEGPER
jgi:hypothetical protein